MTENDHRFSGYHWPLSNKEAWGILFSVGTLVALIGWGIWEFLR